MTSPFTDNWYVFIGLTCVLFGGVSWLTGTAIAATWRPAWQAAAYALLLTAFDRFLHFAVFYGDLLSVPHAVRDFIVILCVGLAAWRFTHVTCMVRQYPWLYRRTGVFSYRER